MRDYQVQGLNWMASLHHNGINGILADEMVSWCRSRDEKVCLLPGPGQDTANDFLPWISQVPPRHSRAAPHRRAQIDARQLEPRGAQVGAGLPHGRAVRNEGGAGELAQGLPGMSSRQAQQINDVILTQEFDVLITSYELCIREKSTLKKFSWEYIIIDEAHRIKNVDSLLSQIIRMFTSRGRLLITGTPLQNNLHELWALLNFILPDVFSSR